MDIKKNIDNGADEFFDTFIPPTDEEYAEIERLQVEAYLEYEENQKKIIDNLHDDIKYAVKHIKESGLGKDFDNTYNECLNDHSKVTIAKYTEACAKKHLGEDFKFRPNQKEAIVNIVHEWLEGTDQAICSAPTGSGKSIIALLVAAVLSEYYNKTGYILISDLSLIEQYERDVNRYFNEWAVIKGQQTYRCEDNGLTFNMGTCKLKGCKTYGDIRKKFPSCSSECQYILEREKAINSPVLVCTYSFWLIQQNMVKKKLGDMAPFDSRSFTICDEAHKLVSIVQNHFSPKFGSDDVDKIHTILNIGSSDDDDNSITEEIFDIRKNIRNSENNEEIFKFLRKYVDKLKIVEDSIDTINRDFVDKTENNEQISKEDRQLMYACNFISEHISGFNDYVRIISKTGSENIVKNEQEQSDVIVFNCIDESYLMGKCFHNHCGKRLYMSATIGEPKAFAKDCGFGDERHLDISIPSTFDYTNSPIFYVCDYKLSFKEKDTSLPNVVAMIEKIAEMYGDKRGIIQTGSYQFAKYLQDNVNEKTRRRLFLYDDSKEKQDALYYFKQSQNKILVGPSLVEGLSFDDDLSRFQIIMKIPYPSLKDKFVAAKQRINPEWYSNTTAISILQGVGRGIRNEKDWCVTFVLDGCFTQLLKSSGDMFPMQFLERIKVISPSMIFQQ